MTRARIVLTYGAGTSLAGAAIFGVLFGDAVTHSRQTLALTFAAATLGMVLTAGLFVLVWGVARLTDPASTEPLFPDDPSDSSSQRSLLRTVFTSLGLSPRETRLVLLLFVVLLGALLSLATRHDCGPRIVACPFRSGWTVAIAMSGPLGAR